MKFKCKAISLFLALNMILGLFPNVAFAAGTTNVSAKETDATAGKAKSFTDTTNHWAEKAIARWAGYGVIKGDTTGKFRPSDDLTRGEMAAVLTNLLGLTVKAQNTYIDLKADAWFADAVLKCTAAGIMKGDGSRANPNASISRQESMVMLARALGIAPAAKADLAMFTDGATVANWAAAYVTTMTQRGIVSGVGNNLVEPNADMSRASVMTVLDKAVSDYINMAGSYDKIGGTGIVLVTTPNVVLKGNKIAGSLLVSEGVGDGSFTLDGTNITGKTTIRGGGVNSFVVKGGSKLGDVTIARTDGAVRIVTSDGSTIETTYIDDGKDTVIMEGSFGNVSVGGEVPVTFKGADAKTVTATGKNADITVDKTSKVETVATTQQNTKITVDGTVNTVAATEKATGMNVTVSKGGTTVNVTTAAPNSNITVAGTVTNMSATKEATGVNMNVSAGGNAKNVVTAAPNSTISNDGKMGTVSISKDATTAKIVVGEKSTMDKIVSENKSNLTVTTAAAEKAAKEAAAAKAAAEKAAADKLAAEKALAEAKTAEQKAAAEKAAADAKAAAEKAAAEKSAAAKAEADAKAAADKAAAEADKKTENKPVVVPEAPKVDENKPGEIVVPTPTEPEKPTPPPSGGGGDGGGGGGGDDDTSPIIPKSKVDEIISGGITNVNAAIAKHGDYAELGKLQANSSVTVNMFNCETKVSAVYTDIVQVLVDSLKANTDIVSKITANTKDLVLTKTITAQDIEAFVKASGLHGTDSTEITGTDTIGELHGQTLTAVVTDVYGGKVTYTVKFVGTIPEANIDAIIRGGITNVNTAISANGAYAVLSDLLADNSVTVNMSACETTVSAVYTDIVQVLVNSLKANTDIVSKITANTKDLVLSETITAQDIEAFVKASGLHGTGSTVITGADTIGELHGQTLTAVVTDVYGGKVTYTVEFVGSIPESKIDEIITGGITNVKTAIRENGAYAVLSDLLVDNSVTVDIDNGAITVSAVYNDIVQVLVNSLKANTDIVSKITANTKDLVLTKNITAQDIKDFVKASGLHGTDSTEITGADSIDELVGQTLTAVVTDVYGGKVTYTVEFVNTKNAAQIDEIIRGGITNVNTAIEGNTTYINYAVLGDLKADNSVKVTIRAAQTPVSAVYTDIVQVLVDALKANLDTVSKITANTKDLVLSETITAQDIKDFVKASGLHGLNSTEITGSDTIGELHDQTLTAVVTSANGAQYTYTVTFGLEKA